MPVSQPKSDDKNSSCTSMVVARDDTVGAFYLVESTTPLDFEEVAEGWTGGCGICIHISDALKSQITLTLTHAIQEGISHVGAVVIVQDGRRERRFLPDEGGLDALLQNPGKLFNWHLPEGVSADKGRLKVVFLFEGKWYLKEISLGLFRTSAVNI
jgi:hypothetical protein